MSIMDNNLDSKLPQDENPGCDAEDTPVQQVLQEGGAAVAKPPADIGLMGVATGNCFNTTSMSPAEDTEQSLVTPLDDSKAVELEVDPGTFKVMQGRQKSTPNQKKVSEIQLALQRGSPPIPPPIVYEDIDSGERFSPDGAHRQAAHAGLGRCIRIRLLKVKNAKERAEEESCRANIGNGLSESPSDTTFRFGKACEFHRDKYGRYPKPSELATLTGGSRSRCAAFLREFLTPKSPKPADEPLDEVDQRHVADSLKKTLISMKNIKLPNNWIAGDSVRDVLTEIADEAKRIGVRKQREVEITREELEDFRRRNNLTLEKLAELIGVKHTTVSRWFRGKTKMTEHNQRAARQLLKFTPKGLADIMEGGDADGS